METIYFVYLLTFANGKIYVGMSKTDKRGLFTLRYNNHANAAKKGKNLPVYSAWRKYGAPVFSIIGTFSTRQDCAIAEINEIAQRRSTDPGIGYNIQLGGEGNQSAHNPRIHAIMREKIWDNPEWRAKLSAANKGKLPSPQCLAASTEARKTDAHKAVMRERVWNNPKVRAKIAEKTKAQMANGGSVYLSKIMRGKPSRLTPEQRAEHSVKMAEFMNSPEGKEIAKRGRAAMAANPENIKKMRKGQDAWRASDRNIEQCKEMAKRSAAVCSRKVIDSATGIEYKSQREAANALGVSDAYVSKGIKSGKFIRI